MDDADRFKKELELSQSESDLKVLKPVGATPQVELKLLLSVEGFNSD